MPKPKQPARRAAQEKPDQQAISDAQFVDQDEDYQPQAVAIASMLEEAGDDNQVKVFRQGAAGHKDLAFLFSCLPAEWLASGLNRIQADYGTGTYRIHVQGSNGFLLNRELKVEAPPKPAAVVVAPAAAVPDAMAQALAGLAESMRMMAGQIAEMQKAPSRDPLASFEGIAKIAETLRPQAPAPALDITTLLGASEKFFNLMDKMRPAAAPGAGGEGGGVMDTLLGGFMDILSKRAAAAQPMAGQGIDAPELAAPVLEQGNPAASINGDDEMQILQMLMKAKLKKAVDQAKAGAPAADFAASIYEILPPAELEQLANDPAWFASLCAVEPACAPFSVWFGQARAVLLDFAVKDGVFEAAAPAAAAAAAPAVVDPKS